jgi:TP901 family phage tail tape measure protein
LAEDVRRIVAQFTAQNKAAGEIAAYNRQLNSVKTTVMNLGRSMLAMAGVGGGMYMLRRELIDSIKEFADYEKGLAKISTQLDSQTIKYLPQYDKEIRRMSREYGEAAASMTKGTYDILSSTIDAADAMEVLNKSTRSAIGGFTTADVTVSATVQILKAYNWEVEKTARLQDIMHATVRRGRMDFEDYASNVGDVIGLTAYLDIELEAVGASLATMTKAGLSADKAVTALKNILNQFINPSEAARKAAAELGFTLDENSVKGAGLITIMDRLKKANAAQLEALMPSIRGLVGFASQLKNSGLVAEDYKYILNSVGLAEENFQKASETTSYRLNQTKQHWLELKRSLGEVASFELNTLLPVLNDVTDALSRYQKVLRDIQKLEGGFSVIQSNLAGRFIGLLSDDLGKINNIRNYLKTYNSLSKMLRESFKEQEGGPETLQDPELFRKSIEEGINFKPRSAFEQEIDALEQKFPKLTEKQIAEMAKVEDENQKFASKRAQITARMYDDLGIKDKQYRDAQIQLLDLQLEDYSEFINDKALLDKWYQAQERELTIKMLESSDSIADGFRGATMQMEDDLYTWGELGYNVATSFRDSMASAFYDSTMNSKNFFESFSKSIAAAMVQIASFQVATGITRGIGGALDFNVGEYHRGGEIGNPSETRFVSPDVFIGAKRAHNGLNLATNEVPIIATTDESVVKTSSLKSGAPTVNIYNQTGQPFEASQPQFDGEKWVLSIIAKNARQDGRFRKMIRG